MTTPRGVRWLMAAVVAGCGSTAPPAEPPSHQAPVEISGDELEALRASGSVTITANDETIDAISMQATSVDLLVVLARVCVTADGAVDSVDVVRSSDFAAYDAQVVADITATWTFRPDARGAVCGELYATDEAANTALCRHDGGTNCDVGATGFGGGGCNGGGGCPY